VLLAALFLAYEEHGGVPRMVNNQQKLALRRNLAAHPEQLETGSTSRRAPVTFFLKIVRTEVLASRSRESGDGEKK
jgi:hypothetical protein